MLKISMFPPSIGGAISENGNPQILAIDEANGIVVAIEINSQNWKAVLKKLGRLEGVGIHPVNSKLIIPTGKIPEQ